MGKADLFTFCGSVIRLCARPNSWPLLPACRSASSRSGRRRRNLFPHETWFMRGENETKMTAMRMPSKPDGSEAHSAHIHCKITGKQALCRFARRRSPMDLRPVGPCYFQTDCSVDALLLMILHTAKVIEAWKNRHSPCANFQHVAGHFSALSPRWW
jgi:hypothetical protein